MISNFIHIDICVIYVLCTWQQAQVEVCIMHMVANLSSSSYFAHGNQLEFKFKPTMREINKELRYNVSQVKISLLGLAPIKTRTIALDSTFGSFTLLESISH